MFYCSPSEYAFNSVRSFKTIVVRNQTAHSFYTKNYTIYYVLTTNCMLNGSCVLFIIFFFFVFCCCFFVRCFSPAKDHLANVDSIKYRNYYFNTSIIVVTKWAWAWNWVKICAQVLRHLMSMCWMWEKKEKAKELNGDKVSVRKCNWI